MRRFLAIAIASAFVAGTAAPARPETALPPFLSILGSVTNAAQPVGHALVIALNLSNLDAIQTYTSSDGRFNLPPLKSGIYKVIAAKQGFLPAITTVVPTKADHKVTLRLETEKQARRSAAHEIWEIRGSLPADILRELDAMLAPVEAAQSYDIPRFRGEMVSMTGVAADQTANPAFAHTALGVQSRIGDNWQLGFHGNLQRFEDTSDNRMFGGTPLAQSSVMSMELRSSPTDSYRLASTQSFWRYRDGADDSSRQADVRAHNFEWEHGDSRVQVRYLAQENLFRTYDGGSAMLEIAGDTSVLQTRRSDIGVSLRVVQESLQDNVTAPLRTADVAANGTMFLAPSFVLHYGLASRLGVEGTSWAPRTGAEWKLTKHTSVVASAMYKVLNQERESLLPSIVVWSDQSRVLPRYAYSFGVVSSGEGNDRLSAIVTVSAVDSPLRVVFSDGFDQFWDGLLVDSGDTRRDIRVAYRKELGNVLAIDIGTTAGTAEQHHEVAGNVRKVYLTGDLQSTFLPTGTTIAISYRELQQPQLNGTDYKSERVNLRLAQSLYLPLDLKLLLGLEMAHSANSPFLVDAFETDGASRKYIGGLAVNF